MIRSTILATMLLTSATAFGQTSTHEDFKEFCDAIAGRWIGEVTWVADWPGLGERGDKVTAYYEASHADDGHSFVGRFYGGNGSATVLTVYDARKKQIKSTWISSGGELTHGVVRKEGDKWIDEASGVFLDGTKTKGRSVFSFSDSGDTLTIKGNGSVGDKPNEPRHDVWRRVNDGVELAKGSESFRRFGKLLVGRWIGDITFINDWEGQDVGRGGKAIGYMDISWGNDKKSIEVSDRVGANGGKSTFVWDAPSQQIKVSHVATNGGTWNCVVTEQSANHWKFDINGGGTANGEAFGGTAHWTFSDDGQTLRVSGQVTLDGKKLDELTDVYRRVN